jgi:hypothetical protein
MWPTSMIIRVVGMMVYCVWREIFTAVVTNCSLFWDIRPIALLATCFILVSCLAHSLFLEMQMTCSSETSVDFQWTTRHYVPEHRTLLMMVTDLLFFSVIQARLPPGLIGPPLFTLYSLSDDCCHCLWFRRRVLSASQMEWGVQA